MNIKSVIENLFSFPVVYTIHAAAVAGPKKRAIARIGQDWAGKRVLDLGCGTGNSASSFIRSRYTGIDLNPAYVTAARKRFPGLRFVAGPAEEAEWDGPFDLVLINSFLHHLPDPAAGLILQKTATALSASGVAIIQEPLTPGPGERYHRLLMKLDRGDYFRTLEGWLELIAGAGLIPRVESRYGLRILGWKGYHMASISARPGPG
jgi:trans-aconitate methyltransferase